jgi:hypothetical protein
MAVPCNEDLLARFHFSDQIRQVILCIHDPDFHLPIIAIIYSSFAGFRAINAGVISID